MMIYTGWAQVTCEGCESTGRAPWNPALQAATVEQIRGAGSVDRLIQIEEHVERHGSPSAADRGVLERENWVRRRVLMEVDRGGEAVGLFWDDLSEELSDPEFSALFWKACEVLESRGAYLHFRGKSDGA